MHLQAKAAQAANLQNLKNGFNVHRIVDERAQINVAVVAGTITILATGCTRIGAYTVRTHGRIVQAARQRLTQLIEQQ